MSDMCFFRTFYFRENQYFIFPSQVRIKQIMKSQNFSWDKKIQFLFKSTGNIPIKQYSFTADSFQPLPEILSIGMVISCRTPRSLWSYVTCSFSLETTKSLGHSVLHCIAGNFFHSDALSSHPYPCPHSSKPFKAPGCYNNL